MFILKLVGGAFIIGATSLMGYCYSRRDTLRENELLEMKKALTIMKNEIRFALTPFGETALSISERVKAPVCLLFAAAGNEALKKSGDKIADIWQSAVESAFDGSYYSREDTEAFKAFGKSLGCLDKEMQNQSLDLVIEYIDSAVSSIRESSAKQSKMYRSLGFLCGVLVTVILF